MKIPNHIEEMEENEVEFGHYHSFGEKSCQENWLSMEVCSFLNCELNYPIFYNPCEGGQLSLNSEGGHDNWFWIVKDATNVETFSFVSSEESVDNFRRTIEFK